jgi:hypothetical protein
VGVIHAFLDLGAVDDTGLLYMVIGIPFISFAYTELIDRKHWVLMKTNLKTFKRDTDIEMYIN